MVLFGCDFLDSHARIKLAILNETVFIGLPVYNSRETIEASVQSILNQTHMNWVLVIRDNQSNDGTYEMCCKIAEGDSRISVVRNEVNIGAWPNFVQLIQQCEAPYFKWHAADDVISADFLEKNLEYLKKNLSAVGSFSRDSTPSAIRSGLGYNLHDFRGDFNYKFREFLLNPTISNAAFYSLFRSDVKSILSQGGKQDDHLIQDWSFVLRALKFGDIVRCSGGDMLMGERGFSTLEFSWVQLLPRRMDKVFPYRSFIKSLMPLLKNLSCSNRVFFLKFITHKHADVYKGLILYRMKRHASLVN